MLKTKGLLYVLLSTLLIGKVSCYEYEPVLGQQYIQFPTSTNNSLAQKYFILGLAHLHSFGYQYAIEQFEKAINLDSKFAMAYVFLSLSYIQPVWLEEDSNGGWKQVERMNSNIDFANLARKEQLYVQAIRKLFGDGLTIRYDDYICLLKELYALFPTDNEIGLFLVAVLFRRTQPEIRGYLHRSPQDIESQMNILSSVLKSNPDHPGALHYFTHVYDQPLTALSALSNAMKYSRIASSSPHAQHMVSHLHLRLGLFQSALLSNLESDETGGNLQRELHSVEFMHYIYLNMGKRTIALQLLENIKPFFVNGSFYRMQYGIMYDRHIVETQNYSFPFENPFDLINCSECKTLGDLLWLYQINSGLLLVKGFSTVKNDQYYNLTLVQNYIRQLSSMSIQVNQTEPTLSISIMAMQLQLRAFHQYYRLAKTNEEKAIALDYAQMASELELSVNPPCYGPPIDPVKPSQELFGELLLENKQYSDAIDQFLNVMAYFPNRTLTLIGLARGYSLLNQTDLARSYYSRLMNDLLAKSDYGLSWYEEAYNYLSNTSRDIFKSVL
ncbi:unnamed protein product [Adineta ricciae]|uniref:Tetratricopeptide repeat protein n=1 Tax=Adineta ricciae TaxID=249248 RepID=A0A814IFB2_ADIRI|nr:unnamed protein product [Adineta ricciae]CAF1022556.1 unnamed protein product [Adineta ricciae]